MKMWISLSELPVQSHLQTILQITITTPSTTGTSLHPQAMMFSSAFRISALNQVTTIFESERVTRERLVAVFSWHR